MSVAHHDDVIKSLLARAANTDVVSKMFEAPPKRAEAGPQSSVCSVSSQQRPKAPLSILEVLCAKANDVEIASKVSEATDQFSKLGRGRNSRDSTKVAANLCVKASSFSWDHPQETESLAHDDLSKSFSKVSNASNTLESSVYESNPEDNHGVMTPDEFMEMAKGLVTAPSGGDSVSPPPCVVTASRSSNISCDMSTTSDITDWDFSSRGGSSSGSPYDADRVVENVYKLAAADPVLARRIAMAANITKIVEEGYLDTAEGFSKLSPVREHAKSSKKGKKQRMRDDLPPLQPFISNHTRSVLPPTPPVILRKKRTNHTNNKTKREHKAVNEDTETRPKREPSGSKQQDDGQLCFVQDNHRTHK